MAMNMTGEVSLPASRETVWEKLNNPEVLKLCIPGCQSLERTEEGGFAAVAKLKIGPVSATFRGKVELTDLDPPNGYRISGSGDGGIAGNARGGAKVSLSDAADGHCLLAYQAEASIGGKIAQLGARMIDSVAKKMADQFFEKFAGQVAGSAAPEAEEGAA